ncbi:MAG: C10 family peptidase, partial [Duncaniella sp.]|nr:C10 family peptidase [Duncaniella sp.]
MNEAVAAARLSGCPVMSLPGRADDGWRLVHTEQSGTLNTVYVLNRDEGGFVVLSADNVGAPVLGYSATGSFDSKDMPVNMQGWLEGYSAEIATASRAGLDSYLTDSTDDYTPVEPLLKTFWGQGAPYNALCPEQNSIHTPAGCVATAIAQIMKYHSWPVKGVGEYSYQWNNNGVRQTLSCDFSHITFEWDKMLDSYKSGSDVTGTQEQKDAVAQLIYAAGIGSNMNYSLNGSGASAWNSARALIDNFDYDKSAIYLERRYYTLSDWTSMVYDELSAGRPVYYEGYNFAGGNGVGHAFVVDGYQSGGYFHLNWGWEGKSNGYFLLTALDPKDQGIGGSSAGYNGNQAALFGVGKPLAGSEQRFVFFLNGNISTNLANYVIDNNSNGVVLFSIMGGSLGMMSTPTKAYADGVPATPGFKVSAADGDVYYVWGREARFTPKYKSGGTLSSFSVPLKSFHGTGEYILTPAVKYGDSHIEEVVVALGSNGEFKMASDGTNLSFEPIRRSPKLVVESLTVSGDIVSGQACRITASITNRGSEYYGYIYPRMYNESGSERMSEKSITIPQGATVTVEWNENFFNDPAPGDYQLTLTDGSGSMCRPIDVTVYGPTLVISNARFMNAAGTFDFTDVDTGRIATKVAYSVMMSMTLKCTKGPVKAFTVAPEVFDYNHINGKIGMSHGQIQSRQITLNTGQSMTVSFSRDLNKFDGEGGPLE